MQNMHIQQGQLRSSVIGPTNLDNPWGSRLHSVDTGWLPTQGVPIESSQSSVMMLRINLGAVYRIVFMDYQQLKPEGSTNTVAQQDFYIRYGLSDDTSGMRIYQNIDNNVS